MLRVVKRLKRLKSPFRKLLHNHGNLHERVNKIRTKLDEAQKSIDRDPFSSILHEENTHYLIAFKEAQLDKERFLKQKAKIEWLKAGDSTTAYFHKIVKSKCARNRIDMVSDASNNLYDGNQVPGDFVNHYNQFLGAEGVTIPLDDHDLFTRVLDDAKADFMVRKVSNDDVKSVIFSIGDGRAPGPDGFIAAFFKKAVGCAIQMISCIIVYVNNKGLLTCILADDLFLFSRGNPCSVAVIMDVLEKFKQVSGLVPSIAKSTAFFCNVSNAIKASILNAMPFAEGVLPGEMKKGKAKVAWESVCMPKHEGGLVGCAWDTIRVRAENVDWYNIVWFPHCIPRHAMHMWLVFQQKLKTQDRLWQWDVSPGIDLNLLRCPLCDLVPDSHGHLFFECAFSSQVWSKGKMAVSILSRLMLAATSHCIWLERNGRLYKKKTSSSDQIVDVIISMVRLKLVTFKFKNMSTRSRLLLDQWKIPSNSIVHNGSSRFYDEHLKELLLILQVCMFVGIGNGWKRSGNDGFPLEVMAKNCALFTYLRDNMASSHQQELADADLKNRPPLLEKGSYVTWASRFIRNVDGKKEQGISIRRLIEEGLFKLGEIPEPDSPADAPVLRPHKYSNLTGEDKLDYEADIDVMNWIILGIPNNIYKSVDSCSTAQQMWKRVQRLMQGTKLSKQKRQSRVMNEFDKFYAKSGESLESVVEIQGKSSRYVGGNRSNAGNQGRNAVNQRTAAGNDIMLLATKNEAGGHLDDEENEFVFIVAVRDDQLEELNASVFMMASLQPTDNDSDAEPNYDSDFVSEKTSLLTLKKSALKRTLSFVIGG
uniref:Reverse transcriptase domain, reverse transcriptase zinc-binding domain protein n=1 Tax=Tanacetum cinerariifolium TaxID=118510 RepID=A0A6L2J808_TANCI|nr:reverse transcriptase domain, reverse transcriptase zinc-binding domain protein [Tanacetum cinerariifolium]